MEVEKILIDSIEEWLKEGNIDGKTVNQNNLDRLNAANLLCVRFFRNIKQVEFEPPQSNRSFAQTFITCENFSIEDEKLKNRELFEKFMQSVDSLEISAGSGRELYISFGIDGIWQQ